MSNNGTPSVVAVCVSQPKPFSLGDRYGNTGIFKEEVPGRVRVGLDGFVGDAQVDKKNHGGPDKAVYAYSTLESSFWAAELSYNSLPPGKFGENLLVDGLDGAVLTVGDIYRIGTAVLQVSQPRIPCFKIGVAFNSKKMAKLFFNRGRTGIYLRVLQPGEIGSGDKLEKEGGSNENTYPEELYSACFHPTRSNDPSSVMMTALDEPALSSNWKEMCQKRLKLSH